MPAATDVLAASATARALIPRPVRFSSLYVRFESTKAFSESNLAQSSPGVPAPIRRLDRLGSLRLESIYA